MSESKGKRHNYEGMFLVSQASASDLNAITEHIRGVLDRAGAQIIAFKKWDERRLAYEIQKQKRGVFFLSYFSCDPANLAGLERDCNLSEEIMRFMFVRADHLTEEEMRAADGQEELATEAALRSEGATTEA